MPKFKVEVDKEACIGCGNCATVCPDSFELVEGKAKPKKAEVEELDCIQEAADGRPVQCIKITKK